MNYEISYYEINFKCYYLVFS